MFTVGQMLDCYDWTANLLQNASLRVKRVEDIERVDDGRAPTSSEASILHSFR